METHTAQSTFSNRTEVLSKAGPESEHRASMPGEQFSCHRGRYTSCTPGQELDPKFRLQILNAFCGGRNSDAALFGGTCNACLLYTSDAADD